MLYFILKISAQSNAGLNAPSPFEAFSIRFLPFHYSIKIRQASTALQILSRTQYRYSIKKEENDISVVEVFLEV